MEAVLAGCFLDELPERLIGDKAYDSDALDEQMSEYGIEMISPVTSERFPGLLGSPPIPPSSSLLAFTSN